MTSTATNTDNGVVTGSELKTSQASAANRAKAMTAGTK